MIVRGEDRKYLEVRQAPAVKNDAVRRRGRNHGRAAAVPRRWIFQI